MRSENEIFRDLTTICQSPGYIHALAGLCFTNTAVGIAGELKPQDLSRLSNPSTLIRTELNTLYGLMINGPIGLSIPSPKDFAFYTTQSERLLDELHAAIKVSAGNICNSILTKIPGFNPFASAAVLREPIFYAAQSAYPFQYRDLAPRKYRQDAEWLLENKGLDLDAAQAVSKAISELLSKRLFATVKSLSRRPITSWTMLPGFTFTGAELANVTGLDHQLVLKCIEPFCVQGSPPNKTFTSLHAFNSAYAYPFIKRGADDFVILQPAYGYSEALYDTPFYWMGADKAYSTTAMKHRGDFAEDFAHDRLTRVFGDSSVFMNVEIFRGKETLGEIDVLVVFGDRAIVLQAKSKKLTLPARNGNDLQLKGDFKAAVQDAVDQSYLCAALLDDPSVVLRCRDGVEVRLPSALTTVFPLTIVTDHYPALAFQAKQLLTFQNSAKIVAPLVIDVFALDAITEMLSTPLRFLSYIWLRAKSAASVLANHELVALSYHLQNNLWIEPDLDMVMLHDDISLPLDVAMAVRRDGMPGSPIPEGLLTKFKDTRFQKIVTQIEREAGIPAISLGFALMELGEAAIDEINRSLRVISRRALKDRKSHDFTLGTEDPISGITFHVAGNGIGANAERTLHDHCRRRKYLERADRWHGVTLDTEGAIHLVATLSGRWEKDLNVEDSIRRTVSGRSARAVSARSKLGRNKDCPCGSGKNSRSVA